MEELAREADVARETVMKFENKTRPPSSFRRRTIKTMRDAFERHRVKFLDNGEGPGVRLVLRRDQSAQTDDS